MLLVLDSYLLVLNLAPCVPKNTEETSMESLIGVEGAANPNTDVSYVLTIGARYAVGYVSFEDAHNFRSAR